jgi:hypothetical protein
MVGSRGLRLPIVVGYFSSVSFYLLLTYFVGVFKFNILSTHFCDVSIKKYLLIFHKSGIDLVYPIRTIDRFIVVQAGSIYSFRTNL